MTNTEATAQALTLQMDETTALDEAILLLLRKARRAMTGTGLDRDAAWFGMWEKMPDGAKRALLQAETRAMVNRDQVASPALLEWPAQEDLDN